MKRGWNFMIDSWALLLHSGRRIDLSAIFIHVRLGSNHQCNMQLNGVTGTWGALDLQPAQKRAWRPSFSRGRERKCYTRPREGLLPSTSNPRLRSILIGSDRTHKLTSSEAQAGRLTLAKKWKVPFRGCTFYKMSARVFTKTVYSKEKKKHFLSL